MKTLEQQQDRSKSSNGKPMVPSMMLSSRKGKKSSIEKTTESSDSSRFSFNTVPSGSKKSKNIISNLHSSVTDGLRKLVSASGDDTASVKYYDKIPVAPPNFNQPREQYFIAAILLFPCMFCGYAEAITKESFTFVDSFFDVRNPNTSNFSFFVSLTSLILAAPLMDNIGRRATIFFSAILPILGGVWCTISETYFETLPGILMIAAIPAIAAVVSLAYMVECSSPSNRGCIVTIYLIGIYMGQFFGRLLVLAIDEKSIETKWRLYYGCASFFGLFQLCFISSFPESPLFRIMQFDSKGALAGLKRLRNHRSTAIAEHERMLNAMSVYKPRYYGDFFKSTMTSPYVLKIAILSFTLTALVFICGRMPDQFEKYIFIFLEQHTIKQIDLVITLGVIVTLIVSHWIVDVIGRRRLLYISFFGMSWCSFLLGLSIYQHQYLSDTASSAYAVHIDECNKHQTCWDCVTARDVNCGFCYKLREHLPVSASCVKTKRWIEDDGTSSQCHVNSNNHSDFHFTEDHCPSNHKEVPVLFFTLYKIFYSAGGYRALLTFVSEVPPQWARSRFICVSVGVQSAILVFNEQNLPSLFHDPTVISSLTSNFIAFAILDIICVFFVYHFIPETACRPLEFLPCLFMPRKIRKRVATYIGQQRYND